MTTPVPPTEILVQPTSEQLLALRDLMLPALRKRGVTRPDAEDAVQRVLARIPVSSSLAGRLVALDQHAGYFVRTAVNEHLMQLRAERARRAREQRYASQYEVLEAPDEVDRRQVQNALELAAEVDLTARQREYLGAIFVEGRSIEEIAADTGTSAKAVQAVLRRATAAMRKHLDSAP